MAPAELSRYFRKAARSITPAIIAAETETLSEAMKAADKLSSGTMSTAALRAAGHPYSRQHPNPAYDAAIINVQSGRFRAAWKTDGPKAVGGIVRSRLTNSSPEAAYMIGTSRMIARPIAAAILTAVAPDRSRRLARLRAAILQSFRP